MKNIDKLRLMSSKKLAEFICSLIYEAGNGTCNMCKFRGNCRKGRNGVYVWLEKVAKNKPGYRS